MQEYRILWFEDNFDDFDEIIVEVEAHLKIHQRKLIIEQYDGYPADFDVKIFEPQYCMALIDLNLKNQQKGIEIIKSLRKTGAYIDILLYSNNPSELIELTEGKNFIEGIHRHATLKGIDVKIKGLIDQNLYKEIMILERKRLYEL